MDTPGWVLSGGTDNHDRLFADCSDKIFIFSTTKNIIKLMQLEV